MKNSVASESLFEFSNKNKKPIKENFRDAMIDDREEEELDVVDDEDEEEWVESPEDKDVIDDIEKVEFGDEIVVDDDEIKMVDTNKTLLKQLKTIIDINKGKPDKEKNYVTFTIKGKPNEPIDGIPFDIKGNKDETTIMFIRKGTKNVKMVPLKNVILESKKHVEKLQMVRESLNSTNKINEWSEYEYQPEPDNYQDFLFKVANHMVEQWDQEVLLMLDLEEYGPEKEDTVVEVVNFLDDAANEEFISMDPKECFSESEDPEDVAEKIAMNIKQRIHYGNKRYTESKEEEYSNILKEENDDYTNILKNLK